jgi:hypothetical protein
MIAPLHVANVGGHPLRFFRTPLTDGRPDLPWHCIDDLQHCLGLNRQGRKVFPRMLRSSEWRAIPRTVATADGVVTIAPHFIAQGMIDAMVENGRTPASVRHDYDRAGADAMKKFGVPSDQLLAWLKAALNRWEPSS